MAKDTRTITGTVRIGKNTFGPDSDPDALAAALSPEQVERLTGKGVIDGFAAKEDKRSEKAADKQTDTPKNRKEK